ncbi:MAG: ATP-dependent Clp protease proteolytic subunit, partial [bacterium]
MKKIFRVVLLTLMIVPAALSAVKGQEEATIGGKKVVRIVIDGAISPVVADYIDRSLKLAVEEDAALLILQLDTPGGLISSTRQIVKTLLGAEVPVAVHVAPPGARAASAGVFITMAGHIAAMAPGTNIGAAHPVSIGGGSPFGPGKKEEGEEKKGEGGEGAAEKGKGTDGKKPEGEGEKPALDDESVMAQKVINDTVAFARSLAERHGRNADWAERAVRESVSGTEKEALELNVIDVVAETTEELIKAIDGRKVTVSGKEVVLALKDSPVEDHHMGWRHKVLSALSDPNIAYILMMLGIYGLFFELANPGVILPGVLGGIFLILAFFSF